jgi:hypothetical protein
MWLVFMEVAASAEQRLTIKIEHELRLAELQYYGVRLDPEWTFPFYLGIDPMPLQLLDTILIGGLKVLGDGE